MDEAIEQLIEKRGGENAGGDLLGRLMRERDAETGQALSAEEIRGQMITVIGAGHQSVALALCWIWYLLGLHPWAETKVHAELEAVLGGRTPAVEDLARLPWLRMVIEETLRLYPPFPVMAWRGVVAEDEVCGVRIPKGATVCIAPWVLHRHTRLWEDPERFDPERFLPERSRGRSRYAYLPFGTGPRVCIGASFAMTEMMLVMATLAQHCRLRTAEGHRVEPRSRVTLQARQGWKMTVSAISRREEWAEASRSSAAR
jgi:cytochrome P450